MPEEKIKILVTNPSASGFHYAARGFRFFIPGGIFEPKAFEIPQSHVEALAEHIRKRRPVIKIGPAWEEPVEEPVADPAVTPETMVPMSKEEFFGACQTSKVTDMEDTWTVIVPDGREFRIEATHHLKAKQAAYGLVYGGAE